MKKINQKDRQWEPSSHEDPKNPGVYKRVLIRREEANPKSKLISFILARLPVGKTNAAHIHKTMEEIFYFTEGEGEIKIGAEIAKIGLGDRVIIPAGKSHQITNTGKCELRLIGLGVALD